MAGEETVQLRDVCVKIGSGATPRGGKEAYKGGATALIRSQNIYNDGFHHDGLVYIDDIQSAELRNVEVKLNDVLLNITGDSVARCCQVSPDVLPARVNQHVAIIRPQMKSLDARFLRYVLISHEYQLRLMALASAGATRPALTKSMIEELHIPRPPLDEQKSIAHILGTLDDKIELNRKMNETLEAMAQALFKSWFIDFDPVRRNAARAQNYEYDKLFPDSFQFSELGSIPRGWNIRSLSDLFDLIGGGTPKTSKPEYWDGDIPWFSVVDAPSDCDVFVVDTEKHITKLGLENSSTKILPVGATIISARGTVGKCALVGQPMAMNQSCYGLRGKENIADSYVYFTVRNQVADLQRGGHGSVFNTITRDTFSSIKVSFSGEALTNEFQKIASPWLNRILNNLRESCTLATLRYTLLPKLLGGEIKFNPLENYAKNSR